MKANYEMLGKSEEDVLAWYASRGYALGVRYTLDPRHHPGQNDYRVIRICENEQHVDILVAVFQAPYYQNI